VYVVAGRHDPADSVVFDGCIMRRQEVFIRGPLATDPLTVQSEDEHGALHVHLLPVSADALPDCDSGVRNVLVCPDAAGRCRPWGGFDCIMACEARAPDRGGDGRVRVSMVHLDGAGALDVTGIALGTPARGAGA
jgi:hypothetical protein